MKNEVGIGTELSGSLIWNENTRAYLKLILRYLWRYTNLIINILLFIELYIWKLIGRERKHQTEN